MVETKCEDLQKRLGEVAPALCPTAVPKGWAGVGAGVEVQGKKCGFCSVKATEELVPTAVWKINFGEHKATVDLKPACKACSAVVSLSQCSLNPNVQQQRVVDHFLKTNGYSYEADSASGMATFQEAVSIAFALQVFVNNIPDMVPADKAGTPLAYGTVPQEC